MEWVVRVKRAICSCLGGEKRLRKARNGSCIERHRNTCSKVSNCLRGFETVLMETEAFGSFKIHPHMTPEDMLGKLGR